ncbi:MAG: ABC transporter ATP-binding protein [Actinobacteria bacterium]|nr:ABC transporter ATP-binding protein [Actinomycetota bacterium]
MTEGEPVLELIDLEVRYGAVPAVRDLSLQVHAGEVVALIGPNGAGKSTTLLAIMGVLKPSAGDIRFAGESIKGVAPERIARGGLSLVPEGRRIFSQFTVEENLRLGLMGRSTTEGIDEDLEWVYSLFPVVKEAGKRTAGQLSGGQQQQLAIARALVARPQVLLLDEPTLGLAPVVLDVLFEALGQIRDRGVSMLLVEQRAQQAIRFSDRTLVMRDAKLAMTLGPEDAADSELLADAYFGS